MNWALVFGLQGGRWGGGELSERLGLQDWASLCHLRHGHLQQPVVLALAGHDVAVLGGDGDELHTHFVLLELHQEPAAAQKTGLNAAGRGRRHAAVTAFYSLTRRRCRRWAAPCRPLWCRCGAAWWWSRSCARCWVRSRLWWPRPSPEPEKHSGNIHQYELTMFYHLV